MPSCDCIPIFSNPSRNRKATIFYMPFNNSKNPILVNILVLA